MAETDYAIIVGINDYNTPPFGPLRGAKNDAIAFRDWVTSTTGGDVPPTHVIPYTRLSDPAQRIPRISDLYEMIETVFAQPRLDPDNSRVGRRLYLFFAGHGLGIGDLDESHLVTLDAAMVVIPTLPGCQSANTFARAALFEEIILFMDCCRTAHPSLQSGGLPAAVYEDSMAAGKVNRFFAFATPYGDVAREAEQTGVVRGHFSRVLMEGLEGAATDAQGRITTTSLRRYLEQILGGADIAQNPKFPSSDEIVLVSGRPPRTETVTIELTRPLGHFTVIDGATFSPVAPEPDVETQPDGSLRLTLPVGKTYLFEASDAAGEKRYQPWIAASGNSHVRL